MSPQIDKTHRERIALQEIRSFPGGEFVLAVEIEQDVDQRDGKWRLHTMRANDANIDRVEYAARTTRRRPMRRYSLRKLR